jgi:pimeloyl-ACP methyl ester carboxylesterase
VNHHREGSGEPIVLIHGIGHHWQGWLPVIERLARDYDVIATDSPGFGQSPPLPPGVEPTVPAYANAFAEFFRSEGFGRPHVAGNSMGGAIGLELARRGRVRSVTAISPAGFWTPAERRYSQAALRLLGNLPAPLRPAVLAMAGTAAGRAALLAVVFAKPTRVPVGEVRSMFTDTWASQAFGPALRAFDDYVFRDGEGLATIPITVAWGSKDRLLIHGRQAPRARRALPQAEHVTLDGLGHTPFYDDPEAVASVIRETAGRAA